MTQRFLDKFIKLGQLVILSGALILLFGNKEWFPSYYKPGLMAIAAFIHIFLIQLPRLVFRINGNGTLALRLSQFRAALTLGLLFSGLGSLGLWGLYKMGIPYDKIVHFAFSGLLMYTGTNLFEVKNGWSIRKSVLIVGTIIGSLGVVWEGVEFLAHRFLNLGFFGEMFDSDSTLDIILNLCGVILGGLWARLTKR